MYDISQNPFYLYSVHRSSVSGKRSRANGPLVLPLFINLISENVTPPPFGSKKDTIW